MKQLIQSCLIFFYAMLRRTKILSTSWGQQAFRLAYEIYKQRIEARTITHLKPWVLSGSHVIDVGANVGFFSSRFATWVGEEGRVIAIEPEKQNLRHLDHEISRLNLGDRVDVIRGVAAEKYGTLSLAINPDHPGDHRIACEGVSVPAYTLDGLLSERDWPSVSFVKIDVQGAETRVLKGARTLLSKQSPVLFMEIDPDMLISQQSSPNELLDIVDSAGYCINLISQTGVLEAVTKRELSTRLSSGVPYIDILCVKD